MRKLLTQVLLENGLLDKKLLSAIADDTVIITDTLLDLTFDAANSTTPFTGSSGAATISDTFAYDYDAPNAVLPTNNLPANGWYGNNPADGLADSIISYTFDEITDASGKFIVIDAWGRPHQTHRSGDFDIVLYDGNTQVGTVTGNGLSTNEPYYTRVYIPAVTGADGFRGVGHNTSEGDTNYFNLMEIRASLVTLTIDSPAITLDSIPVATQANQTALPISGTAEIGNDVEIFVGDTDIVTTTATPNGSGVWNKNIDVSSLPDNHLEAAILVKQTVGGVSASVTANLDKDATSPDISIDAVNTVTSANESAFVISGTATFDDLAPVLTIGSLAAINPTVTENNTWTETVDLSAESGAISVNLTQADSVGNSSSVDATLQKASLTGFTTTGTWTITDDDYANGSSGASIKSDDVLGSSEFSFTFGDVGCNVGFGLSTSNSITNYANLDWLYQGGVGGASLIDTPTTAKTNQNDAYALNDTIKIVHTKSPTVGKVEFFKNGNLMLSEADLTDNDYYGYLFNINQPSKTYNNISYEAPAAQVGDAPVIALEGGVTTLNLAVGDTYTPVAGTWTDTEDGSGSITPSGATVDTSTAGAYVVTYNHTDTDGNVADQKTVVVNVVDTASGVETVTTQLAWDLMTVTGHEQCSNMPSTWKQYTAGNGIIDINAIRGAGSIAKQNGWIEADEGGTPDQGCSLRTVPVPDNVAIEFGELTMDMRTNGTWHRRRSTIDFIGNYPLIGTFPLQNGSLYNSDDRCPNPVFLNEQNNARPYDSVVDSGVGQFIKVVPKHYFRPHGWCPSYPIDLNTTSAVFIQCFFRLVMIDPNGPDNRHLANFVVHAGTDSFTPQGKHAGGNGSPQFRKATNQWKYMCVYTGDATTHTEFANSNPLLRASP